VNAVHPLADGGINSCGKAVAGANRINRISSGSRKERQALLATRGESAGPVLSIAVEK
jgi:hypothetical protein